MSNDVAGIDIPMSKLPDWFKSLPAGARFQCCGCGLPYCAPQPDTNAPLPGGCDCRCMRGES